MIEKIVNKLLDTQIKSGLLKDETIPIYRYGYTLLIEVTINVILSLVIGFALGEDSAEDGMLESHGCVL